MLKLLHDKIQYEQLLGREFVHGSIDCYDILLRMFADNFGKKLTNYARPDDWWVGEHDLYVDNYKQEGFFLLEDPQLKDLRPFDVMLVCIPDPRAPSVTKTNHCAVYIGDGQVIHHRLGKMSQVIPYRGWIRDWTTHIIRHHEVPDLRPQVLKPMDLKELILPHKRERLFGAKDDRK